MTLMQVKLHWTATDEERLEAIRNESRARQLRDNDTEPADNPPLPHCSTGARPGSLAKIAIMRERVAAGLHLHHPSDARDLVMQRKTETVCAVQASESTEEFSSPSLDELLN